jgi:hypothetical protein
MKKLFVIGILAAVVLIAFGVVGFAYAQSQDNGTPAHGTDTPAGGTFYGCGGYGAGSQQGNGGRMERGMMGNRGANNQGTGTCPFADGDEVGYGPLHETMLNAFAQAFGLTRAELDTRLQAGDTMWTIAQEQGMTAEQFQQTMTTARTAALNQAVADGVITQEQADFMLSRMNGMMGQGFGSGQGFGPGSGRGNGTGNGGCPHFGNGTGSNQP